MIHDTSPDKQNTMVALMGGRAGLLGRIAFENA